MTVQDFVEKIESGEAKILTVDLAKKLKGKRILWVYFGYEGNETCVNELVVGDIVTSYDYNKNEPMEGYASKTEYWESYMSPEMLQDKKDWLMLLDSDGKDSYIYAHTGRDNFFEEPTFTCSDADRPVFYLLCEQEA